VQAQKGVEILTQTCRTLCPHATEGPERCTSGSTRLHITPSIALSIAAGTSGALAMGLSPSCVRAAAPLLRAVTDAPTQR
jgi:hypothetical protein